MYAIRSYYERGGAQAFHEADGVVVPVEDAQVERQQRADQYQKTAPNQDRLPQEGGADQRPELIKHVKSGFGCATSARLRHDPVITSYSIHYTKLYDAPRRWVPKLKLGNQEEAASPPGE